MMNNKIKIETFDYINYVLMTVVFLIVAYPLYFVVIASISDPLKVATGEVLLYPKGLNWEGYKEIFSSKNIFRGYRNSLLYTSTGTLAALLITIPAGFALSRSELPGKNIIMTFFVFTMFFTGGLIPTYLQIVKLGIYDTIWALILPVSLTVYNLIIVRTFFQTSISKELHEAAVIEGCGYTRFLISIVIPLSKAIIAVICIYVAVGHWNSFFQSLVYLRSESKFPLQLVLRSILIQNQFDTDSFSMDDLMDKDQRMHLAELIKYGIIIVASLPMMILYPFLQKYFARGIMIGSIKG